MGIFRLLFQRVQGFADQLACAIHIRVCNVQIKHGSYSIRSGRQHVNSQAVRLLNKLTCGDASQPEANNVRLDRCGIDVDFRVGSDLLRKCCSAGMDLTQTTTMMFLSVKGSRRDDSSLTEATAKLLFEPSCPGDERLRASKAGPDRRPESFREADAHSVKCGGVLRFRDAGLCGSMPETSPVRMNGDPMLTGVAATASICSKGQIEPPPMLCVFSTQRSFTGTGIVVGKNGWGIPSAATTSSGLKMLRTPGSRRGKTPDRDAGAPPSRR